jgi:hypothetical protein
MFADAQRCTMSSGQMAAFLGSHVDAAPITQAVGRLKTVRTDGSLIRTARALGICLGD